jgi:hypothetical protein
MAMSVYTAGGNELSLCIDHVRPFGCRDVFGDLGDLAVVTQKDAAVFVFCACHGFDVSVLNEYHILFPFYAFILQF